MHRFKHVAPCLLAAALLAAPTNAAVTVYHDPAAFQAVLHPVHMFEDFNGMNPGSPGQIATFGPMNGYAFTAYAEDGLYSNGNYLSTFAGWDEVILIFTGAPVHAVGGEVWGSDVNFNPRPSEVVIGLSGGTTMSLFDPAPGHFIGFTSTSEITWISFRAHPSTAFPTLDNFFVGTMIPEPAAAALLALGSLLTLGRRRYAVGGALHPERAHSKGPSASAEPAASSARNESRH